MDHVIRESAHGADFNLIPPTEEVLHAFTGVLHRGFGLVDRQPKLGHYRPRPRQSLGSRAAAEDGEAVSIVDDVCPKLLATTADFASN